MPEEPEARELHPFKIINRGQDTVAGDDERVVFADFSPRVVPSETPDEEIDNTISPKAVSAPVPAESETGSTPPTAPTLSGTPAPAPAPSGDGKNKSNDTSSPSSSSSQNPGPDAPPASD